MKGSEVLMSALPTRFRAFNFGQYVLCYDVCALRTRRGMTSFVLICDFPQSPLRKLREGTAEKHTTLKDLR